MFIESLRPQVVAFDGLHRSGKGTQAKLLHEANEEAGVRSRIVRGDGTREGLGLVEGDPYSKEWQELSRQMKSGDKNSVEDWNHSSLKLMKELQDLMRENQEDMIIVDRSILSRVAFLLHRGVIGDSDEVTIDDMYPGNLELDDSARVNLESTLPDVVFNLQSSSVEKLLKRLDAGDPKYEFRARNIKGGFDAAKKSVDILPVNLREKVFTIDCSEDEQTIHRKVVSKLGSLGLGLWLRDNTL